jgi:transcriptional regulator with GAF, ATPase, and Fis domain
MASTPPASLAEIFGRVARALLAAKDVDETLEQIAGLAVETIDGCDFAAMTIITGRSVDTPAATDDVARAVDAIQYETGEGPCLDAIRERQVFRTDDLATEDRWPAFAHRAEHETGIVSMLSFRLFVEDDTMGALNLYSKREAAFDDDAVAVGAVFASHAAVALSSARHDENMDRAIASRDIIGQAKGILMSNDHLDADAAFDALRSASQRLNRKLVDVATDVTKTGELPTNPDPPR